MPFWLGFPYYSLPFGVFPTDFKDEKKGKNVEVWDILLHCTWVFLLKCLTEIHVFRGHSVFTLHLMLTYPVYNNYRWIFHGASGYGSPHRHPWRRTQNHPVFSWSFFDIQDGSSGLVWFWEREMPGIFVGTTVWWITKRPVKVTCTGCLLLQVGKSECHIECAMSSRSILYIYIYTCQIEHHPFWIFHTW